MKIVLIDPPHEALIGYYRFYFPLGLLSVGSVLSANGHDVALLDAEHLPDGKCLSNASAAALFESAYDSQNTLDHPVWRRVADYLRAEQPDVVGITALSCKVESALMAARLARTIVPRAKIVVGGDHTVGFGRQLAAETDIDAVVVGEGEDTVLELITAWESGRGLESIRGLAYRAADGTVQQNARRRLIEDLDRLPQPDRSLLVDIETYRPEDMGLLMSSRGCSERCTFCGIKPVYGGRIRFRTIGACLDEMADTRERYGTDYFSFRDGTFTIDRQRTLSFCRALNDRGLDVSWECLTRADRLDDEVVTEMMAANCGQIRLGLESGSPRILEYIGKNTDLEDYRRAADVLNRHGMFWSAYLMLGVPEDTLEDIQMTLDLIERLQPSFLSVSHFVPLPGTPIYQDVAALGRPMGGAHDNNKRIERSYSRHISDAEFRDVMDTVGRYVADYNRCHSDGRARRDRRLHTGFEEQANTPTAPAQLAPSWASRAAGDA